MKELNIREIRAALSRLEELLAREGEIVVTRRSRGIARVLPIRQAKPMPSHADLRSRMPRLSTGSEVLVREDRDR